MLKERQEILLQSIHAGAGDQSDLAAVIDERGRVLCLVVALRMRNAESY
jgi:hypothetical protein